MRLISHRHTANSCIQKSERHMNIYLRKYTREQIYFKLCRRCGRSASYLWTWAWI